MDSARKADAVPLEKRAGAQGFASDSRDELIPRPCHLFVIQQPQDILPPFDFPAGDILLQRVHAEVDLAAGSAAPALCGGLPAHGRHLLAFAGGQAESIHLKKSRIAN